MLNSNPNPEDFSSSNQQEADKSLLVRFVHRQRQDLEASKELGRPVFKEVEYIEIRLAGKRDPQAVRPATLRDKQRFPKHYEAFQKRTELPLEGTPLAEWGKIPRSTAEELAFMNVKTVEQLADINDTHLANFMNGNGMREAARKFLADEGSKANLQARIKEQDVTIAEMQEQIKQLSEAMVTPEPIEPAEPVARKRRKTKAAQTEDS